MNLLKLTFLLLVIFPFSNSKAQNYADKSFYLVDSLDKEKIDKSEIILIDSCLNIFHSSISSIEKLNIINHIVKQSYSNDVWPKYNTWIYNFAEKQLKITENEQKEFFTKAKAEAINNYGYLEQVNGNNKKAIEYYQESITLFKSVNDKIGEANSLNNIGSVHYFTGEVYECLKNYKLSLDIRESIDDLYGIANSLNNIGMVFQEQGNIENAVNYYVRSLKIRKELGDLDLISTQLSNIGLCYLQMEEPFKAQENFEKSLNIDVEQGNHLGEAKSIFNLGRAYQNQGNLEMASSNYNKSLNKFRGLKSKFEIANALSSLAETEHLKGNNGRAIELYNEAMVINRDIENQDGVCHSLEGLSTCFFALNELTKAEEYAMQSLIIAEKLGYANRIKNAARSLSKILDKAKKYEKALFYHKLYKKMNDSLVSEESKKSFELQQAEFVYEQELAEKEKDIKEQTIETQEKEHENELLNEKVKNQNRTLYFTIAGLIIIGALLIILIIALKKSNIQKKEIEQEKTEKEILLKEIHHRVKNSLQITTSVIRLQKMNLEDENAIKALEDSETRISAIALVHKLLYQDKNISSVSLKGYLTELTNSNLNFTDIKHSLVCPEILINTDKATPLALITSELISNAVKHAFTANHDEKKIDIKVIESGEYIKVQIEDNGKGLPTDFNINNETGLGFEIINALADQIDAKINTQSSGNGTSFEVVFKA